MSEMEPFPPGATVRRATVEDSRVTRYRRKPITEEVIAKPCPHHVGKIDVQFPDGYSQCISREKFERDYESIPDKPREIDVAPAARLRSAEAFVRDAFRSTGGPVPSESKIRECAQAIAKVVVLANHTI